MGQRGENGDAMNICPDCSRSYPPGEERCVACSSALVSHEEHMRLQEERSRLKICPDCSCDYLAHIDACAKCGAALVTFAEHTRLREERRRLEEGGLDDPVAVREGEVRWLSELYQVLITSGIASKIHSDPSCGGSCRGNTCQLLVSRSEAEKAHLRIEDYFAEVHPEVQESRESMSEGKCPACGSAVASDEAECHDCGLVLLIIE